MFTYALMDQSKGVFTDSANQMQKMIQFADKWAAMFCAMWGLDGIKGEYVPMGVTPPKTDIVFNWMNADPSVPDAAGYHTEVNGVPLSNLLTDPFMSAGAGILDGGSVGLSLLSVFLHELGETVIDPYIDDWVQMPDGRFIAKEVSDPVQSAPLILTLDDGTVGLGSNAVGPRYFDQQAPIGSVFDLAGKVKVAFQLLGYWMIFDPSYLHDARGPVFQVFGSEVPQSIQDIKSSKLYRGRSGIRVAKMLSKLSVNFPHLKALLA